MEWYLIKNNKGEKRYPWISASNGWANVRARFAIRPIIPWMGRIKWVFKQTELEGRAAKLAIGKVGKRQWDVVRRRTNISPQHKCDALSVYERVYDHKCLMHVFQINFLIELNRLKTHHIDVCLVISCTRTIPLFAMFFLFFFQNDAEDVNIHPSS